MDKIAYGFVVVLDGLSNWRWIMSVWNCRGGMNDIE